MMGDMSEHDELEGMTDDEIARAQREMEDELYLRGGCLTDDVNDGAEVLELALAVGAL